MVQNHDIASPISNFRLLAPGLLLNCSSILLSRSSTERNLKLTGVRYSQKFPETQKRLFRKG